jgi:hypothetical protein
MKNFIGVFALILLKRYSYLRTSQNDPAIVHFLYRNRTLQPSTTIQQIEF